MRYGRGEASTCLLVSVDPFERVRLLGSPPHHHLQGLALVDGALAVGDTVDVDGALEHPSRVDLPSRARQQLLARSLGWQIRLMRTSSGRGRPPPRPALTLPSGNEIGRRQLDTGVSRPDGDRAKDALPWPNPSRNGRKLRATTAPPPLQQPRKQGKLRGSERLDRTQEVAGSSSASSIKEVPANTPNPGSAPFCKAANLGQNSQ